VPSFTTQLVFLLTKRPRSKSTIGIDVILHSIVLDGISQPLTNDSNFFRGMLTVWSLPLLMLTVLKRYTNCLLRPPCMTANCFTEDHAHGFGASKI
jgi:hypothetical protein